MTNAEKPAFPNELSQEHEDQNYTGLTKRELFAAMAMQGLLSNPDYNRPSLREHMVTIPNTVKAALAYTDELLRQLETTK